MVNPVINTLDDNYCELRSREEDLTNKQFNNWLVLGYKGNQCWLCECQCENHTKKIISAYGLENGLSKSCGRTKEERETMPNYVGNTYKDITIIKSVGRGRYLGRCKCGAEKLISGCDIKRGKAITCNHFKQDEYNSYIGKKFGELEVVKVTGAKATCKCSCGNTVEYYISGLLTGSIKSCGCIRDRKSQLLVGKKFGYLTIEKYLGHGIYQCKCVCGKIVNWRTGNITQDKAHSCGCMESYVMRTKKDALYNRKRTDIQLGYVESKENLEKIILENTNTPIDLKDLAEILGTSVYSTIYYVDKYNLRKYIKDMTFYSYDEKDIGNYIESKGIHIERHNKSVLRNQELDIYIPDKRIAIEFNGSYWHSTVHKDKYYHQNKTIDCAKHGVQLIHIFEYEWKNDKDSIINYLDNILGNSTTIYARKCTLRKITDIDEERDFLNKYHLQGYTHSEIALGLYYNDKLISLMSFDKPRFNHSYEYEIIRYCVASNYKIIGGAQKLFKYFIDNMDVQSIITYCNISKFTGNMYTRLGFTPIQPEPITQPNYVWVNADSKVIERYQTQESELIDKGYGTVEKSEDDIMYSLSYMKIYDSGNIQLEWRRKRNA